MPILRNEAKPPHRTGFLALARNNFFGLATLTSPCLPTQMFLSFYREWDKRMRVAICAFVFESVLCYF
jgi:hypothetical protein